MATKTQGDTLVLVPEKLTLQQNDAYQFHCGQLVELCATLTRADQDIEAGETIQFLQVAWPSDGIQTSSLKLVAYFTENDAPQGTSRGPGTYTVSVVVERVSWGQGVARLCTWVAGANTGSDELSTVTATTADNKLSASISFAVASVVALVPLVQSGIYISQPDMDMVPSSGEFIYCQFSVLDANTHDPLENMRIRLSGEGVAIRAWWASQVLLYSTYDASQKLAWWDDYSLGGGADLVTDDSGSAELFLCAQGGMAALGGLRCAVGNAPVPDPTGFVIANLNVAGGVPTAPYTDYGSNPIPLEGDDDETFNVNVRYNGLQEDDEVFVFCNGDFVGVIPKLSPNTDPMGFCRVDCRVLRSMLYDSHQPENTIRYVIAHVREAIYSQPGAFYAKGPLPPAKPELFHGSLVAAPIIVGNSQGMPINWSMACNGLRVRIPLDKLTVDIGDAIELYVYLNGWAQDPHESQPRRAVIGGPWGWKISPKMLRDGYTDWWFQARCFLGFGQSADGDLGTFEAQYQIYEDTVENAVVREKRSKTGNAKLLYSSETLKLPLDTIPPAGYDEWGGDYSAGIDEVIPLLHA